MEKASHVRLDSSCFVSLRCCKEVQDKISTHITQPGLRRVISFIHLTWSSWRNRNHHHNSFLFHLILSRGVHKASLPIVHRVVSHSVRAEEYMGLSMVGRSMMDPSTHKFGLSSICLHSLTSIPAASIHSAALLLCLPVGQIVFSHLSLKSSQSPASSSYSTRILFNTVRHLTVFACWRRILVTYSRPLI